MKYRSFFNLSHSHKLSCDMGQLVPLACVETLPGDSFNGQASLLARIAPLANPVMHDVDVSVHHWYVPNRILWSGWEDFITGADDVTPKPTVTLAGDLDLADHMGMYPQAGLEFDALPVRAYNRIYNEFYRDSQLQTERGEDDLTLARVCWDKDYFTIARPQPQQGDAVELGFSAGKAPVTGIGKENTTFGQSNKVAYETGASGSTTYVGATYMGDGGAAAQNRVLLEEDPDNAGYPGIYADLTNMEGGINLDDLRRALAYQRIAEAKAMYGDRYPDFLKWLGVNPSDGRLSRPEYLGGGKQRVNFSEVITTAEGSTTVPGDLYGHGIAGLRSRRYRKMFEEHGWFLSLLSVRPRASYMQAFPRKFARETALDYWQRELEVLPWQTVSERELYAPGSDTTVFGHVPKYDEYRHEMNFVSGSFRTTEKDWHMGRDITSAPTLNSSFVTCTPPDRIYSDTSMPELLIDGFNQIKAKRLVRSAATLTGL